MREHEISSPIELDAALAGNAMSKREKLWKAAEGRSFRWTDVMGAVLGGSLCLTGLYGALVEQKIDGVIMLIFGISLLGASMLRYQQVQIDALRKLMRLTERRSA